MEAHIQPVINIVLAFYIGDDLEAVIGNPIGQPMATVSVLTLLSILGF